MRILILFPNLPFPPDMGQKHRFAHLALYLGQHHEVYLACFSEHEGDEQQRQKMLPRFSGISLVPVNQAPEGNTLTGLLSGVPGGVRIYENKQAEEKIKSIVRDFDPTIIIAGDPAMTPYIEPWEDRTRILDYVCEATLQFERMQALSSGLDSLMWRLRRLKYGKYLRQIAQHYDVCVVNSQEDLDSLARYWPEELIEIIPNGLDLNQYPLGLAEKKLNTLVYPGSVTYSPNHDAVDFFGKEVLPLIHKVVPEARLWVTGPIPSDGSAPQHKGIHYTGYVDDVRTIIASATICVVPLRLGAGGVRFKVLESLALGTPMVSTAIGYEGVSVTDGVNIMKAESAEEIADRTLQLLRSPELRDQLASAGRRLIEDSYNWEKLGKQFTDLFHGSAISEPRN